MCQPKDIVSSLRDRVLKESDADVGFPKSADADNSRVLRAKLLATSDNISFSSLLGVFVIADQESVYTVKLFPTESCTCPLKKNCVHILGVKLGQRMEIHEDELAIQKNISVVRKNTRPRGYKTFFQSQLKLRLKSLSLISTESEFEFEVIKLSELNLN